MMNVKLICVGKMKEKHYAAAFEEYRKRLGAFCRFELTEISEERLSESPSEKEVSAALDREANEIIRAIPKDAFVVTMCVEGRELDSPGLAALMAEKAVSGKTKLCFIVGGSFGLSDRVKELSPLRLSMSRMTFPHHLARVMLAEQIYRAFTIQEGRKYHK